uniref:Si:ch211-157b11.8 n=1 Tax=Salarias fasciatus TaxID=181472 RepID=A0A672FBZ2_SALFA
QGDRGPAGATGPPGRAILERGPEGPAGPAGEPVCFSVKSLSVLQGASADSVLVGAPGPRGVPGVVGPKGEPGVPGASGSKGDQGFVGPKGDKGERGESGEKGRDGSQVGSRRHLKVIVSSQAKCDMETAGGGWTVIQSRQDGSVDFNRTWQEYREGFGSLQGEHWLGNAALHALTSTGQHQLRIELEDWHQQRRQATYSNFKVASEAQRYRLTAREYSGDAGNAMSYSKRYNHDGRPFSTADRDHDRYASGSCGQYYGAGWWFDACLAANLNGRYYRGRYSGITDGIYWGTWYILTDGRTGERYSFKSVEMKTRPKNFVGTQ